MGGKSDFVVTLTTGNRETNAEFYPFDQEQIANARRADRRAAYRTAFVSASSAPPNSQSFPAQLHGVFKLSDEQAYEVTAPVTPGEVAAALHSPKRHAASPRSPPSASPSSAASSST